MARRSTHSAYRSWRAMRTRCRDPKTSYYRNYGGRGISICPMWDHFWTFVFDMGERPVGASLDRRDNNGNYSPENCRWASSRDQGNNTRTNVYLTHEGVRRTAVEWARFLGIPVSRIYLRRKRGHCVAEILRIDTFRGRRTDLQGVAAS